MSKEQFKKWINNMVSVIKFILFIVSIVIFVMCAGLIVNIVWGMLTVGVTIFEGATVKWWLICFIFPSFYIAGFLTFLDAITNS